MTGEIAEVNETMKAKPSLINSDPYGEGWFVRVKPTDWAGESTALVTGDDSSGGIPEVHGRAEHFIWVNIGG